jgi:hypothetical protein
MLPPNNSYYSSITSYPHRSSHRRPRVRDDRRGAGGETPPSETRRGGICRAVVRSPAVAVARHARARPPRPLGPPTGPGHQRCRPPLPPARAEPHPPGLVPPGLDLRLPHPRQEYRKPPRRPPPPSPPHGDNNALDQRSVEATRDPSPEDVRPRATQSASLSSPPSRAGGGGGAQNTAPCHSRDRAAARSGTSARSFLVVVIVVGGSVGGSARGGGCRTRRQRRKRQRRR